MFFVYSAIEGLPYSKRFWWICGLDNLIQTTEARTHSLVTSELPMSPDSQHRGITLPRYVAYIYIYILYVYIHKCIYTYNLIYICTIYLLHLYDIGTTDIPHIYYMDTTRILDTSKYYIYTSHTHYIQYTQCIHCIYTAYTQHI